MSPKYQLSKYLVLTELLDAEHTSDPSRLLYSTRSGRTIKLKEHVYQSLRQADFSAISDDELSQLIELEVIVLANEDEFAEVLERNIAAVSDSKHLNVTIQPTANCQLGCGYCGQVHKKKNVDEATSNKIVDRIIYNLQKNQFESINVQWYGGEPLMAHKEILSMSDRLMEYCRERGIGYGSDMITNGLSFKPNIFLKLLERKITHYQITLDGLGETHDVMRITKEGARTFDIIFRNILDVTSLPEFQENGCGISVRVNVTRSSAKYVEKLIDRLVQYDLHKKGVTIDFAAVHDWGDNNASQIGLSRDEFAAIEIEWLLYAMQKGFAFENFLPGKRTSPCMAVQKDAEVYDADGNIYPCYEFPYTPAFASDDYKVGHVDTIAETQGSMAVTRNFNADVATDMVPCGKCNLFPVCGGGCPKQWYEKKTACPPFKINIGERVLMNYLLKADGHLREFLQNTAQ
jgi:uncharacterized protein